MAIHKKLERSSRLLHADASAHALGFIRIWVLGIWFLKILFDPIQDLAFLPPDAFNPSGILMSLFRIIDLCEIHWLWILRIAILVLILVSILGLSRCATDVSVFLLLIYQSLLRGFGHVNHGEIALLMAAMILVVFPSNDGLALQKRQQSSASVRKNSQSYYALALIGMTGFLCLTYSLVGIHRLVFGGLSVFGGENLIFHAMTNIYFNTDYPWDWGHWFFENKWLKYAFLTGYPLVTVFEILAPCCLVSRKFRMLFIPVMLSFHLLSLLVMKIFFWENCLLFILFCDLSKWFPGNQELSQTNLLPDAGKEAGSVINQGLV